MRTPAPRRSGAIAARLPHAEPAQRIGLLGGSFNPPHEAHRQISETALKRLGLDRVWWLVSPGNPLKRAGEAAPLARRVEMARGMAKDNRIRVTDFEAELPTAYTASTLAFLKARGPRARYVWLMGADNLASFHRWYRWREIFQLMPIAVVDRPGWQFKALSSPAARAFARSRIAETAASTLARRRAPAWVFLRGPLSALSSSAIRSGHARATPLLPK